MKKLKIKSLKSNKKNPRVIRDDKFIKLKKSITEFPIMMEMRPIVIDKDNIVLGGNMRLKACTDLGWKEVPTIFYGLKEWEEAESKLPVEIRKTYEERCDEFIVKDNVGFGEWDWDVLANEWNNKQITDWGLDVWQDDAVDEFDEAETENEYSTKINAPVYEAQGDKPEVQELFNTDKYKKFVSKIESSKVPDDVKDFLMVAASRHIVFDYSNIAEYYAHANKDLQELMEDSALVIIDFDKAIENGYVKLSEELKNEYKNTYEK